MSYLRDLVKVTADSRDVLPRAAISSIMSIAGEITYIMLACLLDPRCKPFTYFDLALQPLLQSQQLLSINATNILVQIISLGSYHTPLRDQP